MSTTKKSPSLNEAVSSELKKGFDLNKFKDKKLLNSNVKFKEQKWIPVSEAVQEALGIPGIPMGHITLLRGHSNAGKTTALIEAAVSAQKSGILPVFIITEMKWSWEHLKQMGFNLEDIKDEQGNVVNHTGFFIYTDRTALQTIEDVAAFIVDLLDEQKKGHLPYDLLFLWDSIGSIPCKMSVEANKNNAQWNAGAMSQQFGNFVNQKIVMSRKENQPYTNTLLCTNKIWVSPPENPFAQPKMKNKGGETMFSDASLVLTFGNITNSGTAKIKAVKDKKEVEFALKSKVASDKNHVNGITTKGTLVATVHGFIKDSPTTIDKYKKEHSKDWVSTLGSGDFSLIEDTSEWEETNSIPYLGEE